MSREKKDKQSFILMLINTASYLKILTHKLILKRNFLLLKVIL